MSFSIRVCALVIAFSPCRSRKRPYHGLGAHLRWPFPPACRGNGNHGNMACACESLFPVRVSSQGSLLGIRVSDPGGFRGLGAYNLYALISARDALPRQAGAKGDLGVHLRWASLLACRGKGHLMDLVCACGRLSQEAREDPRSARGALEPKTYNFC